MSVMICPKNIHGVLRHRCGQVNEMGECVCLVLSLQRGGEGVVAVVPAWQGVCVCVCVGVHRKTDAYRHGPASFPPDRLSSAQEWDTDTSSRLRHIIWACQGLYQARSTGVPGLPPQSPQAAGYLHTHSSDTSLSQEAYRLSFMAAPLEGRGYGVQLLLCIVRNGNQDSSTVLSLRGFSWRSRSQYDRLMINWKICSIFLSAAGFQWEDNDNMTSWL